MLVFASSGIAAPYAAMVMDMRTGEVIHSRNADTQLHPASLTKMMTLYIAFEAIEHGEISLDTMVTISANAANEPPSKLGLRAGQKIALRYLIRAAAVKSANDAATAIGEAIEGSEAAFARRMNRTAAALGMTRTHFKNANGLTESGHMSTARDMTTMGRHVFFDYPDYYNLFSRLSADVGGHAVPNTNRRFLNSYQGADGIKTGYTRAAGFNLVASAERGSKRIIATVFGGQSTADRNKRMAELLDMGFSKVPTRVAMRAPARPTYEGPAAGGAGKTIRLVGAPTRSIRPQPRPTLNAPDEAIVAALVETVDEVVADIVTAQATPEPAAPAAPVAEAAEPEIATEKIAESLTAPESTPLPKPRPAEIILASVEPEETVEPVAPEVVTRLSTSGGRHWSINVGRFNSQYEAERVLLKTALVELATLGEALRKVARSPQGYDANFVGLTEDGAELACRRLQARATDCRVVGPS
ncbi:D-alanyl-D-alanine carboxypeptidase family protein [Sinisalibacter aestuarii]|nr:D-alanyl-D-alanine carboxypeptidase family protein [Sinisalibacter aestuarii]